ncbi:uncharacterized protein isoform X2 [Musca autumnalis]|uniref:uncharacterized protein isoform X2 n=1 Tax=Musca autumnalis TaxID=221902 RepID=UPI003CEA8765
MELEQLPQDFLFLLEMCKSPEDVFPHQSKELQLTRQWLNYLSTYEAEDFNDLRLVNIYMSHLCAALVEGKLYGPFLRAPPASAEKLQKVDFHTELQTETSVENLKCPTLLSATNDDDLEEISDSGVVVGQEHTTNAEDFCPNYQNNNNSIKQRNSPVIQSGHITVGSTNLYFNVTTGRGTNMPGTTKPCHCPPKPCQCQIQSGTKCFCADRSRAGFDELTKATTTTTTTPLASNVRALEKTSFNSLCKAGNTTTVSNTEAADDNKSKLEVINSTTKIIKKMKSNVPPNFQEMSEDICELLEAISAELSGDVGPGCSAYLENELARYKAHVMSHPDLAAPLKILSSEMKLRYSLLLGLQNELVKLLSDPMCRK